MNLLELANVKQEIATENRSLERPHLFDLRFTWRRVLRVASETSDRFDDLHLFAHVPKTAAGR